MTSVSSKIYYLYMGAGSTLLNEALCSAAAGSTSTLIGHPLDCVKVRLQTRPGLTTLGCASQMLRTEGLGVFARGIGPPLTNAVLLNTIMFVAFAEAQKSLPDTTLGSLMAGAFAGVTQAMLTTPMDWLKIQAQLRGGSSMALLGQVVRSRAGWLTLFSGHTMNLLREASFTAVYLGLYARARTAIAPDGHPGLALVAAASASTGALAWLACYPFDVVKSVQQAQPLGKSTPLSSIGGAARDVWARGGVRGFYRGATASTFRAVLVTCSRLVAYEQAKAALGGA